MPPPIAFVLGVDLVYAAYDNPPNPIPSFCYLGGVTSGLGFLLSARESLSVKGVSWCRVFYYVLLVSGSVFLNTRRIEGI